MPEASPLSAEEEKLKKWRHILALEDSSEPPPLPTWLSKPRQLQIDKLLDKVPELSSEGAAQQYAKTNKDSPTNDAADASNGEVGGIASTLQTDEDFKRQLFESLDNDQKCTLKNLIWCVILDKAHNELRKLEPQARSGRRKAIYQILREGMSHFLDFEENEGTSNSGNRGSQSKWMAKLQTFPWYIDPSLAEPPDGSMRDEAIVDLLVSKTRNLRFGHDQQSLLEWVQFLHEENGAPLFQTDETDSSRFHSKADGAGNTVLMMAVKACSIRTFNYIYNHPADCSVPSCRKVLRPVKTVFQFHLLSEKNAFKENVLHVVCKMPNLGAMETILETIDDTNQWPASHEENCTLVRSKDFFNKNILHQLFGRSLDKSNDGACHKPTTSSKEEKIANGSRPKSPGQTTIDSIIKLLRDWIIQTQSKSAVKATVGGQTVVNQQEILAEMLAEEDAAGYNVLLTAVKNNNVLSISQLRNLMPSPIPSPTTEEEKKKTLRGLMRSKAGIDLVHVCAAYARLDKLEAIAENLYSGLEVKQQFRANDNSGDAAHRDEKERYYGGPVRSSQAWEESSQAGGKKAKGSGKEAKGRANKPDMNDHIFGGPIRPPQMTPNKQTSKSSDTLATSSEFEGWNAMHFACRHGNTANIKSLLKKEYRIDERTDQGKTAGELATEAGHHTQLIEALKEECAEDWLSKYVASVDPISSAFEPVNQEEANRTLKARDPEIRAELLFVTQHLNILDQSAQLDKNKKRMRHYVHCLTSGESVESYLYLCLQLDSAELYKCLINSAYWQQTSKTMSVEDIEESTVRYMMGKREFEEAAIGDYNADTDENTAAAYLQATTVSAKLESRDFIELTIPEDHDDEIGCCNCCMLPSCCKKCRGWCGCCDVEEQKYKRRGVLKYMKNGVIFLSYLRKNNRILEQYDLIGIALLTGRVQMVKCLLMTRQYDLIPKALQVIIQTKKLISCDESSTNPYLLDIKDFATHVVLNAINTLYAGSNKSEVDTIFQYLMGQLPIDCGTIGKHHKELSIKGTSKRIYYTGVNYTQKSESKEPHAHNDCEIRTESADFYARRPGYWPHDASRVCENSATGPYFQHHLKNGVEFRLTEDRRAMKCLILERNTLPMYNILELARKSRVKILFSTGCLQALSDKLWMQPVAAVAKRPEIQPKSENNGASNESTNPLPQKDDATRMPENNGASDGCTTCFRQEDAVVKKPENQRKSQNDLASKGSTDSPPQEVAVTKDGNQRKSENGGASNGSTTFLCNWRNIFCPLGIYISHLLSYAVYLAIFMKYVLSDGYKFGWEQVIICLYIASFFVQELYEAFDQINTIGNGIASYMKSVWNIYDWLLISFTVAGIALVASIGFDLGRYELTTEAEKIAYLNSGNTLRTVFNSKMVLGFGFVFSAVKLLSALRYFKRTGGSLAIMHYVFFNDLLPFSMILAVMIGAFGTYFYTMLTVGGFEFYSNFTYQQDREKLTLVEVYTRPLLAVFGEFDLDNLRRCKESRLNGEFAESCVFEHGANTYIYSGIFFFVLIVNLIMFNMLIAKFSSTVANKDKRSKIDWMFNRFEMLSECSTASILPPPFNLFYYGPLGISYLQRTHATFYNRSKEQQMKSDAEKHLQDFSISPFENFIVTQAQKFGSRRMDFYQTAITVYRDEDIDEDVEPTAANIDFKKLGYQEDEANDLAQEGQVKMSSRPGYRLKTARRRPGTPYQAKNVVLLEPVPT